MSQYHLAQLNVAQMAVAYESPLFDDFRASVDRINELAERSDGFVWRLEEDEEGGGEGMASPFGENMLVNITVWRDLESLFDFVYRSAHVEIMRQRKKWFLPQRQASTVLWWVGAGERPGEGEALARLLKLRASGPGPDAFSFKKPYPAPAS